MHKKKIDKLVTLYAIVAVFVTVLHRANIKRLISGNENKLKFKK